MDLSLDDLIKTNRSQGKPAAKPQTKPPASNGAAPKPGGRKGKRGKAAGKPSPVGGKAKLGGIQKSNKAKTAMKAVVAKSNKGRGMDVDMTAAPGGKARNKRKRGVAAKLSDTLKARIQSVVQKRGGKVTPKAGGRPNAKPQGGKGGGSPTKAAEIKITIAGSKSTAPKTGGKGGAPGGKGRGKGRGRGGGIGRGRGGSIIKPGMQQGTAPKPKATLAGIQKKARTVILAGAKSVAKAVGGRGGGKGRGRGGARGGGRGAPRGLTLAQRFKGR